MISRSNVFHVWGFSFVFAERVLRQPYLTLHIPDHKLSKPKFPSCMEIVPFRELFPSTFPSYTHVFVIGKNIYKNIPTAYTKQKVKKRWGESYWRSYKAENCIPYSVSWRVSLSKMLLKVRSVRKVTSNTQSHWSLTVVTFCLYTGRSHGGWSCTWAQWRRWTKS